MLALDGMITFIPGAGDYSFGQLSQDLSNGITGVGETVNGLGIAIVGVLAWCLADRRARLGAVPSRRPQVERRTT